MVKTDVEVENGRTLARIVVDGLAYRRGRVGHRRPGEVPVAPKLVITSDCKHQSIRVKHRHQVEPIGV